MAPSESQRVPLQSSIATRLLVAVFSIYLLVTITLTGIHMYAEYVNTKRSILQELVALQETFNPGLATAIYNVDKEGVSSMVLGMVRDPMVVGALVETEYQGSFAHGEVPAEVDAPERGGDGASALSRLGEFAVRGPISYEEMDADTITVGRLSLYSSKEVVLSKVWFALAIILVTAIIKTVALWGIFYWFSRRYLVQPLAELTEVTTKVRMSDLERHKVSLGTPGRTELHVLAEAFNDMIDKLAASRTESEELHKGLASAKEKLEDYSRTLEERVRHRTSELEQAKDEAEQAMAFKATFLANMSHEIRSPMNVVLGMADLLEETEADEEQAHLLAVLKNSAKTLLRLIDDILHLSKAEAGQVQLEHIPFRLVELVDAVCNEHSFGAREKGVALDFRMRHDVPDHVVGDPIRIRQVLGNLLSNAVKFTEHGTISVLVEMTSDGLFRFAVKDTGIGIPENKIDVIFESFSQADSSTTRKYGGTGLGLAICKQLVSLLGGRIMVKSDLGQGAEFSFHIPLEWS